MNFNQSFDKRKFRDLEKNLNFILKKIFCNKNNVVLNRILVTNRKVLNCFCAEKFFCF
jgi:hypothetical protein